MLPPRVISSFFNVFPLLLVFIFVIVITLFMQRVKATDSIKSSNDPATRIKRETDYSTSYLVFPQGSNVQLVYCMTISTYAKPQGMYTVGITAGLAWELPHRNTLPYRRPAVVYHRRTRRELYRKIELMLETKGQDGKACVLKALCKSSKKDAKKGTFLQEILHVIFSLPDGSYNIDPMTEYEKAYRFNDNCMDAYARCRDVF